MKTVYFNFYNVLCLSWHDPLFSPVPGFAIKYDYFRTDEPNECPVHIDVYSHPPSDLRRRRLQRAAERFLVSDEMIELQHRQGRMQFTTWIAGLQTNRVELYYEFPVRHRLQWPWLAFPDHLMGIHGVQPLLEFKLAEHGFHILHAGGVSRDGRGVMLPGRGECYKTTAIMELLKDGWSFLADDLIALHGQQLHAFPVSAAFFDYFYRYAPDEELTFGRMLGAMRHVRRNGELAFDVSAPVEIGSVNLLVRCADGGSSRIGSEGTATAAEIDRILAVDQLERLNYVDIEEAMGRFMLQYDQVYGTRLWDTFWEGHRTALATALLGKPFREILSVRGSPSSLLLI